MRFYTTAILSLACLASHVAAFSAVSRPVTTPTTNIDKTMEGIDAPGSFDPTEGDNPALKRNNNDAVWVDQVRTKGNWLILSDVRCQGNAGRIGSFALREYLDFAPKMIYYF